MLSQDLKKESLRREGDGPLLQAIGIRLYMGRLLSTDTELIWCLIEFLPMSTPENDSRGLGRSRQGWADEAVAPTVEDGLQQLAAYVLGGARHMLFNCRYVVPKTEMDNITKSIIPWFLRTVSPFIVDAPLLRTIFFTCVRGPTLRQP